MLTQPVCEEGIPPDPISRVQSQRRSLYQNVKAFRVCAIRNAITAATNGLRTHTKLPTSRGEQAAALSAVETPGKEWQASPVVYEAQDADRRRQKAAGMLRISFCHQVLRHPLPEPPPERRVSTLLQRATAQTASTVVVRARTENAVAGRVRAVARIAGPSQRCSCSPAIPTPLSLVLLTLMQA